MLTLLCGRSGSGKTARVLERLRQGAELGVGGRLLLVPEQFSHQAERALALALGDSASLYAEVLSFTRLANRVAAECGGLADVTPDRGARLLMLSFAVHRVSSRLTICGGRASRAGYLESILKAAEELDSAGIEDDALLEAAELATGAVAEKLRDMALIREAYAQVRAELMTDPRDTLDRLAERLPRSTVGSGGVFVDGFTDFTKKELEVLDCFLLRGVDMTVTLTTDGSGAEEFLICEKTKNRLADMAARRGVPCELVRLRMGEEKPPMLAYLERALTDYGLAPYEGEKGAVELYAMSEPSAECSLAASRILEMMRADPTLRRRDFTVAVRGFDGYAPTCESVMRSYGLAAYSGRRGDILQKPLIRLVTAALDVVTGGWRREDIFAFLKTGLTGLPAEDVDILENYCLLWEPRGVSMWTRQQPWSMNPAGYSSTLTEADAALLERIDSISSAAARPLAALGEALCGATTAGDKTRALWDMLEGMELDKRLAERAAALRAAGDAQAADETAQLWGILTGALEQLYALLGSLTVDDEEFARHVKLLLTQYDVGTIPASLDAVTLCELSGVRGTRTRCLIVLGATADAIPTAGGDEGLFTGDERERLAELGLDIGGDGDETVARELFTVYSALTAATEKLIITWPEGGESPARPSFVVTRAAELLGIAPVREKSLGELFLTAAPTPCLRLAVGGRSACAIAASACIENIPELAERLKNLKSRVGSPRGRLAPSRVRDLYGADFNVSASRAERFSSCRFNYFMKYGLRAQPRKKARFDAAEMGTFVHFILENVTRQVKARGGFACVPAEECREMAERSIDEYTERYLAGRERNGRFIYLFGRLRDTVRRIVDEVADELRNSDFEPLDFELNFSDNGDMPPALLENDGLRMRVGGMVDRVDGWVDGDTLYLRVADYKTGRKEFSLSDVWYGLGMQMLIYLFVLGEYGGRRYGKRVVPAGVLYLPTRDAILSMPRNSSDQQIEKKRRDENRRTGLALDAPQVLEAMERGGQARLSFKGRGGKAPVTLASAERLGQLSKYVKKYLTAMGEELKSGGIDADPCLTGGTNYCEFCEFASACAFDQKRDKPRRLKKLSDEEVWQRVEDGGVYRG